METRATLKAPFIKAKGGKLIHKTTMQAYFYWGVNPHAWGFRYVELVVKLVCKYPSWIRDGILYLEEPTNLYDDYGIPLSRCKHCFAE